MTADVSRTPVTVVEDDAKPVAAGVAVLVADDEEQLLGLCGRVLGRKGYDVVPARSGDEAVRLFAERCEDIRVVVIDATIPPRGAGPVLTEIARLRSDVGVIFTGGGDLREPARAILRANDGVFLRKPFPAAALVRAVDDASTRGETR